MPETTPLIKAALNLRVGVGFDVYLLRYCTIDCLFGKLLPDKNGQKKTSKSVGDLEA